ncbi:cytochrome c oxidase assembly protein COX16-domain-containing protein [Amylocystis lapponica]|nr:cytochrome c oxidase assembly protein COX16-domain-containing protein [Amylocystis lapponica]
MPTFPSHPLRTSPIHRTLRKYPLLFGAPFVLIIVGASFGMQVFTQTRYDLQDQKVSQVNKEEELGLGKSRRKFDIREEYFRLNAAQDHDWEPKRIERPKGLPDWGVPPPEPQSKSSKTDA